MSEKIFLIIRSSLIAFFVITITLSAYAAIKGSATMDNLNAALKGETNASHKYELFAKKADEEGYKQIAKLFRAVSMAESIHRNNHKAVILSLGGKPDIIEYDAVVVKSTKENLQVPLKGETYEKDTMYPKFIKQAASDRIPSAIKTFVYAQNAEKQHERLFHAALNNFGKNVPADYCVSRLTGATYAKTNNKKCAKSKCGEDDEYIRVR